jgi:hypothetical protein
VRIADDFRALRHQQFARVLRAIENETELRPISGRRSLGGSADRALRSYQFVVFTFFWAEHPYFPRKDFREFAEHLVLAIVGPDQQKVHALFREFVAYQERAIRERSEESQAELFRRLSFPIADYIVPEPNLKVWAIAARLMPLFTIHTQMVIAKEFGDHLTLKVLQSQMETNRF